MPRSYVQSAASLISKKLGVSTLSELKAIDWTQYPSGTADGEFVALGMPLEPLRALREMWAALAAAPVAPAATVHAPDGATGAGADAQLQSQLSAALEPASGSGSGAGEAAGAVDTATRDAWRSSLSAECEKASPTAYA